MNSSFLLIGHRTSGKTVLGTMLAEMRGLPFVDVDAVIESRTGRSAAALVTDDEPAFRLLEQRIVEELTADPTPRIIATGGGCTTWPAGIRTIWIFREGWEETALRDRQRLRPSLTPEGEIEWMRTTREEGYRRAAHLCLHIERGCTVEEAARRLGLLADWLVDAAGSPGLAKSWLVPRDATDLTRAIADARMFGMAGVEIRSDVFPDPPSPDVPWLASLRTDDPGFFRKCDAAAAFDCDVTLLRCLDLEGLHVRPLILSAHPDDVFKEYFDFLTSLPAWIAETRPPWYDGLRLKWAPRVKSWVELRYANQLYKVFEKNGGRVSFFPVGKTWKWMRIQRLFNGNELNYISTGCLEHSHRPPSLDYFLPHVIGNHARDFFGVIGDPVEDSFGDVFHRALALASVDDVPATYLKIPLRASELDNCLHLLPQIGFKGLSVTSPLKRAVVDSNFVGSEKPLEAGNTLVLTKGSFLLYDTDECGMIAALEAMESDGIAPGAVLLFGNGGVTPAVTRALLARGWGPVTSVRARDGWGELSAHNVALIIDASGGDGSEHLEAPACRAWLDLRYRNLPAPPRQAERSYNGMRFYKAQAVAQRALWGLSTARTHPLL